MWEGGPPWRLGLCWGPVTKWHSPYRSFHMVLFWHAGKITYLKETDWSSLTVCIIPLAWSLMLLLILYSSLLIYLSSHRDNRNVFSYHLGSKRMIMTWSRSLLYCYNKISKDGSLVKEDLFSSILEGENLCWGFVDWWYPTDERFWGPPGRGDRAKLEIQGPAYSFVQQLVLES